MRKNTCFLLFHFLKWKIELVQHSFYVMCCFTANQRKWHRNCHCSSFLSKDMYEKPLIGGHFEFPVPTGSSYYNQRYLCFRWHQAWQNETLFTSLSCFIMELCADKHSIMYMTLKCLLNDLWDLWKFVTLFF